MLNGCWGYLLLVLHPFVQIVVENVARHDMQGQRTITIRNLQGMTCRGGTCSKQLAAAVQRLNEDQKTARQ